MPTTKTIAPHLDAPLAELAETLHRMLLSENIPPNAVPYVAVDVACLSRTFDGSSRDGVRYDTVHEYLKLRHNLSDDVADACVACVDEYLDEFARQLDERDAHATDA
jgi:hypothetical protein